ncbi:MAG TPA: integrase [Lachnospiraceae bacterium]|nr:integrase [Lachnospiraceae bacterium]
MKSWEEEDEKISRKMLTELDNRITIEQTHQELYPPLETGNPFQEEAIKMGLMVETPENFRYPSYLLKTYIISKKFEGCSINTLIGYYDCITKYMRTIDKPILQTSSSDIRKYLIMYQASNHVTNRTLDNLRSILSSFYNWLEDEGYILKSPVKRIKKVKYDKIIKQPFSNDEIEAIRDACKTPRDIALMDFLYSTGCRVSEVSMLDIGDIDFGQRQVVVFGKGHKERIVYFDSRTKRHLINYLKTRTDSNPALFITQKYPFKRLERSGIEYICKCIGEIANVKGVHPHRFRRTLATNLIYKGVPIEQVKVILGHSKIDTTLLYSTVDQESVKINHTKFC